MQYLSKPPLSSWLWGLIFFAATMPWVCLLLEEKQLEALFVNWAYWILTIYLLGLFTAVGQVLYHERQRLLNLLKRRYWLLLGSLALALSLSSIVLSSQDIFFKTLSDETNMLSVSRSLLTQKKAYNVTEGVYYYQNFNLSAQTLPKRPLLFPYLTHLFHVLAGYDWQHPFRLNQLALFGLLWATVLTSGLRGQLGLGIGAALIIVSSPLLNIHAASAGFDFFSLSWFWVTVLVIVLGMDKVRSKQDFSQSIFWLGCWLSIGFVQIRYENAYLTLGALVFYLILKRPNFSKLFYFKSIPDFLRKAATLIVGSWLLALSQWQFFLNSDKYVERPEQTLLSPAHLKSNLYELLNALLDLINWGDQIISPYRPLLWLILLAGLCWRILILLSHGTLHWPKIYKRGHQIFRSWREEGLTTTAAAWGALLAFFFAQQSIYLLHFFGRANHPSAARFFLPVTLLGSLALVILLRKKLPARYRSMGCLLSGSLLCLLYLPQGQQGRFINQLTLNRETKHIYEVVLADPRKSILFIHERPGQISVLERGAVSVQRAEQELENYQKNLSQGLIQELFYLRRTDTPSGKDQNLLRKGDWLEELRFMITPQRQLVVLRHRKSTETSTKQIHR